MNNASKNKSDRKAHAGSRLNKNDEKALGESSVHFFGWEKKMGGRIFAKFLLTEIDYKRIENLLLLILISTQMSDQEDFDGGDAGSTDCIPIQAGSVKKGGYCMLKGFPCKVIDYSTAKPGKHGSAKATIVGNDIFTGKRYEDSCPTGHNMSTPIVNKAEYEVADVNEDDDFVSLILEDGSLKEDLKISSDESDHQLRADLLKVWNDNHENGQVFYTVISAVGKEKIVSGRARD